MSENEIFYDTYDTVVDWNNIYTEEISKLKLIIKEQAKEIEELKQTKQGSINFDNFNHLIIW